MADLSNSKIKNTYQFVLQSDAGGNVQTLLGVSPNPFIINDNLRYIDGNQLDGYVLKSDANGNASWASSTVGDLYISAATLDNTILKLETTSGSTILVPVSYWSSDGLGNYSNSGLTGNVGIGTATPTEKLEIKGNLKISPTNGGNLQFRNNTTPIALLGSTYHINAGTKTDLNAYVYGNNPFSIWTNNNNRLTILGGGNVGIGTSTPAQTLEVDGSISASTIVNVGTNLLVGNDITTSGNISASGHTVSNSVEAAVVVSAPEIRTDRIRAKTSVNTIIDITTGINIDGNITVSGGIKASGDITTSGITVNGNIVGDDTTNITNIATLECDTVAHDNDTNNKITFGTDTQEYQTGGSSRLDISDEGVRLGGSGARVTTIEDNNALGTSDTKLPTQGNVKAYVDGAYSRTYVSYYSSVSGSLAATNNWILPSIGGGISNHTWNVNSGYAGSNQTVGNTFTVASNGAVQAIPIPFDGILEGFYCNCRNNGAESDPRNAALFTSTLDWGTSNVNTMTLRFFGAGNDDGGVSNSKPYFINGIGEPLAVSRGDVIMPAISAQDGGSIANQCTWTVVLATTLSGTT